MMRSSPLIIQEIFGLQGHSLQHILLLEKRNDSLGSLEASALFCLESNPNLMKATSVDVQWLNNTFDFFQPNRAINPYSN